MTSLMKGKPAISKRRLIIIFILCTILTVSVMTGFSSGLDTDGTTYKPADGMRIVTWADVPDGATPENSDALSCLKYTAQRIYTSTYFRGETHGNCVADIGMGMEYNQEVNNTRVIYGNVMFQEAISVSSLKKVANQRYIEKDTILYRPSTGISNGVPNYPDQVVHWTKDQYSEAYGAFPNELSKYVITPSTLTGIRDENGTATVKSALGAAAGEENGENGEAEVDENDPNAGEVAIEVPQALVKGDDGNYTFTVTLDPEKSSKFYRNEVRSLGDLSGYPEFKFVELTITIDENFFPVSITTVEKYKISLPVVGTPTCTAVLTEVFSSINEPGDVPEQEFFRTQFEATGDEPIVLPKSPSDYLLGTFQPYLDGKAELKLAADVSIGDIALNNIKLSADLKNMNIKAALDGGLYVEYAGDRVYITLNNIKGYITTDKAAALMSDERIAGLLGGLNIPDIDSYIDKDILTTVLGNCVITPEGDLTCIYLPFSLGEGDGKLDVDARIYITEDGDKMTLRRIVGAVKYGSLEIKINASAVEKVKFPAVGDGYECLDSVFELVPEIAGVALETRYAASGTLKYNGTEIGVEAYIDRTDASDIKARATLDYNGIKPVVTYAGGNIYVELGSVKLKAAIDEITDLIKYITELTDFELDPKLLSTLKSLLPATVTDVISMIFDLSVTDGRLELGLKRMAVPVDVALSASDGKLGVDVAVKTDKFGFDIDAGISLALSAATERDISPVGEYVSVSALKPAIDGAYGIATNKQISANVVFKTGDVEIAAKLAADFADMQNLKLKVELLNADYPVKLTVIGKTAYVEINTDKYAAAVSGTLDDLAALLGLLDEYIPENIKSVIAGVLDGSLMQSMDVKAVATAALGALKSLTEKDGVLTATVAYDGITVIADIAADLSKVDATVTANETTYTVSLDGITASANISAPADASRFVKASDLIMIAKSVMPLIGKDVYGMNVSASLFGADMVGDIALALNNGNIAASATVTLDGMTAKVYFENNVMYLTVGSLAVKLGVTPDEIQSLMAAVKSELPEVDLTPVENALGVMSNIKSLLAAKLSLTPCEDGIKLSADLTPASIDAAIDVVLKVSDEFDGITVSGKAFGHDINIALDAILEQGTLDGFNVMSGEKKSATVTLTDNAEVASAPELDYIDIAKLTPAISTAYGIVTNKQISANVVFKTGDVEIAAKLAADFADMQNLKIKLELLNADYPVKLTVIGKTAYVEINTDKYAAAVSGTLDDLDALLGLLDEYIPENIKSAIASVLDGSLMQDIDAMSVAKTALGALKSLTEKNGVLTVNVSYDGITVIADIATDLSKVDATVTANETTYTVSLDGITASANVSAPADTARFVKAADLVTVVKSVMPLIGKDVYGMNVSASLFGAEIDGDVAFAFVNGKIAASASIDIADVAAKLYFENDVMYLTVENTLAVKLGATQDEINALLTKLATALPDIDFEPIEQTVNVLFNIKSLLAAKLSISPCEGGIKLSADLTPASIDAAMDVVLKVSDEFDGITVSGKAFGHDINIALDAILELGTLDGFNVMSGEKSLATVTLTDNAEVASAPELDYIDADKFIDYIAPVTDLVEQVKTAKQLKLDIIDAHLGDIAINGTVTVALDKKEMFADITLFANNENEKTNLLVTLKAGKLYISTGNVKLSLDTAADARRIYDVLTCYIPADNYLNKEIKKLLLPQKGDGLPEGMSVLTDALNRLITLDDAKDIFGVLFAGVYGEGSDSVIKTLLDAVRIKSVTNVFTTTDLETGEPVTVSRDDLAIDIFAPFGISMRVTPIAANGKLEQIDANVSLGNTNISLGMKLNFDAGEYVAPMPDSADKYVSIADFIDAVHNAVNTVTAKNGNDITFEVSSFAFDYDIFAIEYETEKDADGNVKYVTDANGKPVLDADGNKTPVYKLDEKGNKIPVKDEAGRDSPLKKEILDENGKPVLDADGNKTYEKVVAQKIKVTSNGDSALKVRMIAEEKKDAEGNTVLDEDGNAVCKYRFNLEAHVLLEVKTLVNSSPLALDLYIINDKDNPDGIVYLDYCEKVVTDKDGKTTYGQGERIKLDYTSIMEIMAAAMDIMSVNDDTVEMLFGDYRQRIDKTVFESMDIAGLDSIRNMLDSLAAAVNRGKAALGDVEEAWDLVYKAGNVSELINRRETITAKLNSAINGIKAIVAMFSEKEETDVDGDKNNAQGEQEKAEEQKSFGELFKMIVNGISFESKKTYDESGNAISSYLKADVDNEIATQTEGVAHVTVTQSVSNDNKWLLDRIEVGNLDVNTAKLNTFDMKFKAGTDVAVKLPDNPYADKDTRTYSDFSNIKHLLFDVMNTANMLEFDIGGIDTSDVINVSMDLENIGGMGKLLKYMATLDIDIHYNAKVKIIDQGKGAVPRYKTAAAIELNFKNCNANVLGVDCVVIPDCTTRLFFYDNVLYIQGIDSYSYGDENVELTKKGITSLSNRYNKAKVLNAKYVDYAITVDELMYMLKTKDGITTLMNDFLFKLMPLSKSFTFLGLDLQNLISEQISKSMSSTEQKDTSKKTLANIFKGYTYNNGAHRLKIGLGELASDTDNFSDLNVSIVGANDGDDNLLDNYISSLHVDMVLAKVITLNLDAALRNTSTPTKYYADEEFTVPAASGAVTEYARNELESTGLGTFCPYYDRALFLYNGKYYNRIDPNNNDFLITNHLYTNNNIYAMDESNKVHYTIESAISSLLAEVTLDKNGKIVSVENRPGGVQWTRPWKEAYENSLKA